MRVTMKRIILIGMVFILILFGCSKTKEEKDMNDLDIDLNFAFNTTRMVTIDIEGPVETDFNLFLAYNGELKEGKGDTLLLDKQIIQTMTDSTGNFKDIMSLPAY